MRLVKLPSTVLWALMILTGGATSGLGAPAGVPEAYRKAWSDVSRQIDAGIERYRKADAEIEVLASDGRPLAGATLVVRQQTQQFLFGCNLFALGQLDTPELNEKYEKAFARLFNFATLPFYWRELEPQPGKRRFAEGSAPIWRRPPPDALVKWCRKHGITPKGHALMYVKNKFMPDWTDPKDPAALKIAGQKHMAEIAARYRTQIPIWDVVNEELPRLSHRSEWHAVPDDFLAWCFQVAGGLFPASSRLMINDGINQAHVTTAEYEALIRGLLDRKVRVDGIGIQFHSSRGTLFAAKQFAPGAMSAVYERLGRLGLPLYITEITIPGLGDDGPALQAVIVADLFRLWFSTPRMAGVTWWNLADGTAYLAENKALGGLLDAHMNPKPAYQALDRLVNHQWKTNLTLTTDAGGRARFRGFCGRYCLELTSGSATRKLSLELEEGQGAKRVTWKP